MKRFALIAVLAFAGCKNEKAAEAPKADAPAAAKADVKAAPAAAEGAGLKLAPLGLTIGLPADSNVTEMMGSQMIQGGGTVVTVKEIKADDSMDDKDLEAAKKSAADYSPKKFSREEKLADGYILAFDNEGGAGANYFVVVRRTIDGKNYKCETTASTPEQGDKAQAACLSLKKG